MVASHSSHAVADDLGSDPLERRDLVRQDPVIGQISPARRDPQIRRAPNAAGLYDVLDLILDKGIVIDAFVRVSLVGIELLTVDLRVVIASVDTYLRYAEGVERLQVTERSHSAKLPDVVGGGMKRHAIQEGAKSIGRAFKGDDKDDDDNAHKDEGVVGRLAGGVRDVLKKGVGRITERLAGQEDDGGGEEEQEAETHAKRGERRREGGGNGKHHEPARRRERK